MSKPLFFYSDDFMGYDMGPEHPLKPRRLRMTYDLLQSYGVFEGGLERAVPTLAEWEDLTSTHSLEYLSVLGRLDSGERVRDLGRYGFGTGDNPVFPGLYGASALYAGASVCAAQAVMDSTDTQPVAFNISGGLHHAHYDRAAGFCVLNDCAMAIRRLRQKFTRVAYVDIDVHHGDGMQESFYSDPTVLTVSLHETGQALFPGTGFASETGAGAGEGCSVNLPFAPYTTDDTWLYAWRAAALPILRAFDPGAILLQMGCDAHEYDPLADLCLTAQGWLEAVKDVRALGKPIVAVGGGGYNLTTVPRMWTLAVTTLAGIEVEDRVPTSYEDHRKAPTLTDHHTPDVAPARAASARAFAERSVAELKGLLFDQHGIT